MRGGLKKVEKLQLWSGFEPTLVLKNQKLLKNVIWAGQDSTYGPLACKTNALPLSYRPT